MNDKLEEKIPIPNSVTRRTPRQPDGDGFLVCCSGGVRAIQQDKDVWFIDPVFDVGPCAKGVISVLQVQALLKQSGLKEIAFHRTGWLKGEYHSSWSPIVPGRKNHMIGPADIWSQIAGNLARARTASEIKTLDKPSHRQLAALLDARGETERLAQSISLSLRNMDMSIEQIAEFYNEQLANHMASGLLDGRRSGTTLDQMLYAHVHAFFMHLGAARDYLATLIGFRLGKDLQKKDSLARLVDVLRTDDFGKDALLDIFTGRGYLRKKATSTNKVEVAGWLAEVTDLRNLLMHKRPYGARFAEHMGYAVAVDAANGLYRYTRPIVLDDGEHDVLDLILQHYRTACSLFFDCAERSGLDSDVLTLTDADIISVEVTSN
ncbi:hypothetical protein [Mesorhizobium sp.]|uniref:hypothetical protein n=1 Tax=Mesorhizobium sp. TaxID=1871066 RepID=UPI001218F0B4|nr:hypothetical protein [Mesorhizobium sp.]TIS99165.1 MAG: hypothetical protein E5W87_22825 [Mesorhizobium sp.]